nr:MAG TPA: hypothetical protein [Caudoviricetes sp.]
MELGQTLQGNYTFSDNVVSVSRLRLITKLNFHSTHKI